MFARVFLAFMFVSLVSSASEARNHNKYEAAAGCNVIMPCDFSYSGRNGTASYRQDPRSFRSYARADSGYSGNIAQASVTSRERVSGRPAGCPSAYCGCGASLRVFGRIVPELNLAANWLRFPRTSPAPGMVAARRGHVFVLEQHLEGDTWMAYDANSGGRATRIHARSLRGYTVVNPRA
jgi:hypothetical protein